MTIEQIDGTQEGTAYVTETKESAYSVSVTVAGHTMRGDEPESFGSLNLGPNPYDFLLSALGSCTVMTVRWFANKEKWPLEHVEVRLRHKKVHADDCDACEGRTGQVDVIEKWVSIKGDDLSEDQKAKLIEVAERCPVQKTITKGVVIQKAS